MTQQTFIPEAHFQCIRLTSGEIAFCDTEDFALVAQYAWHMTGGSDGYAAAGHVGLRMHHLVLGLTDFSKYEVHHRNHNKLDNRKDNLRIVTFQEHQFTRPAQSNNTSKYKGVYWKKPVGNRVGAWIAQIGVNKQRVHLGRFLTAEAAARAYDKEAYRIYGDIAYLNFPNDYSTK